MTTEDLYHYQIGFPKDVRFPFDVMKPVSLNLSRHAQKASQNDRYGAFTIPSTIDLKTGQIIELGVTGKTITKLVFRTSYDQTRDIIIVFCTENGLVKTAWINLKTDKHLTLRRELYKIP